MSHIRATELTGQDWRKASSSGANGNCVEFAAQPDGAVAVRDSKDPSGPALLFTRPEIKAMLAGAKAHEFDDLA